MGRRHSGSERWNLCETHFALATAQIARPGFASEVDVDMAALAQHASSNQASIESGFLGVDVMRTSSEPIDSTKA
jgi:hypothetical protein